MMAFREKSGKISVFIRENMILTKNVILSIFKDTDGF